MLAFPTPSTASRITQLSLFFVVVAVVVVVVLGRDFVWESCPLMPLHQWAHLHSMWSIYYLYWPHTPLSVYRVCYFLVPHTHVLCMGSGSATGFFYAVRLVYSLLKYFFKFQLWYWIQIYTTKYSNLLLIILILVWIVCSTYRKGEILMQKWHVTSQFVYCYMPY